MAVTWTDAHTLWEDTARDIFYPAFNGGYDPDLSVLADDEILALCDDELKGDFDFLADMSDSATRRDHERESNEKMHEMVVEEARRRGLA